MPAGNTSYLKKFVHSLNANKEKGDGGQMSKLKLQRGGPETSELNFTPGMLRIAVLIGHHFCR